MAAAAAPVVIKARRRAARGAGAAATHSPGVGRGRDAGAAHRRPRRRAGGRRRDGASRHPKTRRGRLADYRRRHARRGARGPGRSREHPARRRDRSRRGGRAVGLTGADAVSFGSRRPDGIGPRTARRSTWGSWGSPSAPNDRRSFPRSTGAATYRWWRVSARTAGVGSSTSTPTPSPVISPRGSGPGGLIVAGGTRGVLDARGRTIAELDDQRLVDLIGEGDASVGMIAKLLACRAAGKAEWRGSRSSMARARPPSIWNGPPARAARGSPLDGPQNGERGRDDDGGRCHDDRGGAPAPGLSPPADRARASGGHPGVRRGRQVVSRPVVWHRRRLARSRASRTGRRAGGPGARPRPHLQPVLPPAAGRGGDASRATLGSSTRVLLQQRHRSGRGVSQVRATLLAHEGRHHPKRDRRIRPVIPRRTFGSLSVTSDPALSRTLRAARARCDVRLTA